MENLALSYLQSQGLILVTRRFRVLRGELDLVCTHHRSLVFVEVRYRASNLLQSAASSITQLKQKHIIFAAKVFLQKHPSWREFPCRFDVVTLEGSVSQPKISWFRDAFRLK